MDLDGIRILDFTQILPGPYATQMLAEMGAEVIKVENTSPGDLARTSTVRLENGEEVGLFESVNYGKKSVAVNLKAEAGREALHRLAETADVVVEQFRPGVMASLEMDYETLADLNPDLVYCSLSGYGQSGPYRDRVGHDLNYVGVAGFLYMNRRSARERPCPPGYHVADLGGGLLAAFAVVSGLLSRSLTGSGEYLDVSMTDAVFSFSQTYASQTFAGAPPEPGDSTFFGPTPWYDVYETADGRSLTLAAVEPRFRENFCDAVDRPDLLASDRSDNEVRAALAALFESRTREEWLSVLEGEDAMVGPVNSPAEAYEDPQLTERVVDADEDTGTRKLGLPIVTQDGTPSAGFETPELGEHTAALLASVGFEREEIDELVAEGVLHDPESA